MEIFSGCTLTAKLPAAPEIDESTEASKTFEAA
jgi:hypothetical protein